MHANGEGLGPGLRKDSHLHIYTDMKSEAIGLDGCVTKVVDSAKVEATRDRLVSREESTKLSELFRLLGDVNRVRLLYALLEAGELCVCDLAATVDIPETTVSQALRLLRTAGVVRARRDGRMMFYRLDDDHIRLLLDLTRQHLQHDATPAADNRTAKRKRR